MAHVTTSVNHYRDQLSLAVTPRTRAIVPPNASTDASTTTSQASNSGESDFQALFHSNSTSQATVSAPADVAPPATPTPESVFGASPWEANPTGNNPDGSTFSYNPWYFATPQAATQVAQMLGGTVVASNEFSAPGLAPTQAQANLMVQMPDGRLINAGLVASFYAHGYPQSYINTLIANEIAGTND